MKRRVAIIVLGLIIGAISAYAGLMSGPEPERRGWLGFVEADSALVGAKTGGRVTALTVREGDDVEAGQVLFHLDDATERAQVAAAESRLAEAQAALEDRLAAEQRPQQIAVLEASRARAVAALELSKAEYRRQQALYEQDVIAASRLDQAKSALDRDRAALAEIERQIDAAQLSAREAQIGGARAAMNAAAAELAQAQSLLEERQVMAPKAGRVMDVLFRLGEIVSAGQPVVELLPPEDLYVHFYVPEPQIAQLAPGMRVQVTCDSCPDDLAADIAYIAPEAEYTPPMIFTREERAKLVFLVKARPVANPATALKPGMPVEIQLQSAEGGQ